MENGEEYDSYYFVYDINKIVVECSECGRKTLIERKLQGGLDTVEINGATCWGCLDEEQKKEAKEKYGIELES